MIKMHVFCDGFFVMLNFSHLLASSLVGEELIFFYTQMTIVKQGQCGVMRC